MFSMSRIQASGATGILAQLRGICSCGCTRSMQSEGCFQWTREATLVAVSVHDGMLLIQLLQMRSIVALAINGCVWRMHMPVAYRLLLEVFSAPVWTVYSAASRAEGVTTRAARP